MGSNLTCTYFLFTRFKKPPKPRLEELQVKARGMKEGLAQEKSPRDLEVSTVLNSEGLTKIVCRFWMAHLRKFCCFDIWSKLHSRKDTFMFFWEGFVIGKSERSDILDWIWRIPEVDNSSNNSNNNHNSFLLRSGSMMHLKIWICELLAQWCGETKTRSRIRKRFKDDSGTVLQKKRSLIQIDIISICVWHANSTCHIKIKLYYEWKHDLAPSIPSFYYVDVWSINLFPTTQNTFHRRKLNDPRGVVPDRSFRHGRGTSVFHQWIKITRP